jgi:hypothetical protein
MTVTFTTEHRSARSIEMPTSRKPKAVQIDPRVIVPSRPARAVTPADEQRYALQMSMDTRQ